MNNENENNGGNNGNNNGIMYQAWKIDSMDNNEK